MSMAKVGNQIQRKQSANKTLKACVQKAAHIGTKQTALGPLARRYV